VNAQVGSPGAVADGHGGPDADCACLGLRKGKHGEPLWSRPRVVQLHCRENFPGLKLKKRNVSICCILKVMHKIDQKGRDGLHCTIFVGCYEDMDQSRGDVASRRQEKERVKVECWCVDGDW